MFVQLCSMLGVRFKNRAEKLPFMKDSPMADLGQRVRLYATLPSYKSSSGFPENLSYYVNCVPRPLTTDEIKAAIDASFLVYGKMLDPAYFDKKSNLHPGKLDHFIFGLDELANELATGLVASLMTVDGKKIIVYDKIFVIPPYQRQGFMPAMVRASKEIFGRNAAILRTKGDHAHHQYSKISDHNSEMNGYKVHGFEFLSEDGSEKFDGAKQLFDKAATQLTSQPESFNRIS